MRSYGSLWERLVSRENLVEAWHIFRKHHSTQPLVLKYGENLSENLEGLRNSLLAGAWEVGRYRRFKVYEPKPRMICCVGNPDRVVHQAYCNICSPLMERRFIDQTYACRKEKGSHKAILRTRELCREYPYFLKIDIRHYFDTVDHDILLGILDGMFREKPLRALSEKIVRSYSGTVKGKGLPIGNLTSQWFANLYLDALDHYCVERLRLGVRYIRYMDDIIVFCKTKAEAWEVHDSVKLWVKEHRALELKDEATIVSPTWRGVPYLGLWIRPGQWRYRHARYVRVRVSVRKNFKAWRAGDIDEERLVNTLRAMDGANLWYGMRGLVRAVEKEELLKGDYGEEFPESERRKRDKKHKAQEVDASAGSSSNRRNRGGSNWNNDPSNTNFRASYRNNNTASNRNNNIGFRVASTRPGCLRETLPVQGANPIPAACSSLNNICEDKQVTWPLGQVSVAQAAANASGVASFPPAAAEAGTQKATGAHMQAH